MMPYSDQKCLHNWLDDGAGAAGRYLWAHNASVALSGLLHGTSLSGRLAELQDRSVLIAAREQLTAALALIELDGVARRVVLLPPDVEAGHLPSIIAEAAVDAIVTGAGSSDTYGIGLHVTSSSATMPAASAVSCDRRTEWVLLTSGTTGVPKMVGHTLASLTGAIAGAPAQSGIVWGTFYDIRRYGGLQIFLRAILCGGSLILSHAKEPLADHLARLGRHGVTHLSGTPSHWRRALMSPSLSTIAPQYVRLSGEIADQAILDNLRAAFPSSKIGHAYASTEAGVGFEVNDGLEGFPASLLDRSGDVAMKVVEGSLRIRSSRAAEAYVGGQNAVLADVDGFVDTGDMVERRGDRFYFAGRKGGIINVGGLKVHPEEVEGVINRHPQVSMSLVRARRNPIVGSIVVADVVLKNGASASADDKTTGSLKQDILNHCRSALPQHKVPAVISIVASLAVGEAGKLTRHA